MSKFKPIGKWIWVESRTGGKTTTEAGIIYNEIIKNKHIILQIKLGGLYIE